MEEVLAIHEELLSLHGGAMGLRVPGLLVSALERSKNLWVYEQADLFSLAAAYADEIVNNHPFVDGNKRTGFVTAVLFLESNGLDFAAPEEEVVTMILGLASRKTSSAALTLWLKDSCRGRSKKKS